MNDTWFTLSALYCRDLYPRSLAAWVRFDFLQTKRPSLELISTFFPNGSPPPSDGYPLPADFKLTTSGKAG